MALPPAKKRCSSFQAIFEVSRLILARNISPAFISAIYFPRNRFTGTQRHQAVFSKCEALLNLPAFLAQRDLAGVARQAVEVRAVKAGKPFQPVQRAKLFKGFGVQLEGGVRGVDAGAAAGGFLGVLRVRRAVGAEEKFRVRSEEHT